MERTEPKVDKFQEISRYFESVKIPRYFYDVISCGLDPGTPRLEGLAAGRGLLSGDKLPSTARRLPAIRPQNFISLTDPRERHDARARENAGELPGPNKRLAPATESRRGQCVA